MFKRYFAVFTARNREFFRDRSSFIWNIFFPFLLLFLFAFIFGNSQDMFKVGVLGDEDAYLSKPQIFELRHIQFIPYEDQDSAVKKLQQHQIDMLLQLDKRVYWVNRSSPKGYMTEQLLMSKDSEYQRREVDGRAVRYIDFVLPGILGMNIMFSCLFGVGYIIVRYRKNGVLKRLKATPLNAVEFLSAHISSRLIIVVCVMFILFFGAHWIFDTLMFGSYLSFFAVLILGAMTMISMSLLIACRTRSEELTGGLLNVASWPMMALSGVWFSLEGAPEALQTFAYMLPLTHIVEASRAISIEGATFFSQADHLIFLTVMLVLFSGIGAWLFSWDSDHR